MKIYTILPFDNASQKNVVSFAIKKILICLFDRIYIRHMGIENIDASLRHICLLTIFQILINA